MQAATHDCTQQFLFSVAPPPEFSLATGSKLSESGCDRLTIFAGNLTNDVQITVLDTGMFGPEVITAVMKETTIEIDGQTMNYGMSGSGPNMVLLIPGNPGGWRLDFPIQLQRFDLNKFTLVAVDPPGVSKSRPPERNFEGDFDAREADIIGKLMKTITKQPYSILGWGDGGVTAIYMASNETYAKDINKLVLWGVSVHLTEYQRQVYNSTRNLEDWYHHMKDPFVEIYGEERFSGYWNELMSARIKRAKENRIESHVYEIEQQCLVFHGDADSLCPKKHAEFLDSKLKNCRYILFEGETQHNLHIQRFDWFKRACEQFLLSK